MKPVAETAFYIVAVWQRQAPAASQKEFSQFMIGTFALLSSLANAAF